MTNGEQSWCFRLWLWPTLFQCHGLIRSGSGQDGRNIKEDSVQFPHRHFIRKSTEYYNSSKCRPKILSLCTHWWSLRFTSGDRVFLTHHQPNRSAQGFVIFRHYSSDNRWTEVQCDVLAVWGHRGVLHPNFFFFYKHSSRKLLSLPAWWGSLTIATHHNRGSLVAIIKIGLLRKSWETLWHGNTDSSVQPPSNKTSV